MKTIKISIAKDLTQQMIDRYKKLILEIKIDFNCPVCNFMTNNTSFEEFCTDCFNRIESLIPDGCIYMKTFDNNEYRLLYWKEILKYLNSRKSDKIRITTLRKKCNEIDNLLI